MSLATHRRRLLRWSIFLFVVLAGALSTLRWGGYLLVADDPLPAHVDLAVPLQGSISGEAVRVPEAIALLQQNRADRVLVSIPNGKFWGAPIPPLARHYLDTTYGAAVAQRIDFCETGPEVNSTAEEARTLVRCIQEHGGRTVAVVTSSYHTRRARMIWRSIVHERDPSIQLWMHAAEDPEFSPDGWWKTRLYAKTWFMEMTKLIWTLAVPNGS